MEKQFAYGKRIRLWTVNSIMESQFYNGKTILLWENNLIMGKQFDNGKTIWLWKNNSIMEQNSIFKKKKRFWNQISIFNFEDFFCISRELRRKLNPESSIEFCHHVLILRKFGRGQKFAFEKKTPMGKQFWSWIKFRFCKQILILKNKFWFWKQISILKTNFNFKNEF